MTFAAVSAVVVHYHAAELAARAVASLRREAAGVELEVLLVDNGSDADERRRLAELPCRLLDAGGNLGYAGGVNLGAAKTAGGVLLLANPDVELLPGCLAHLLAALDAGADVAGPRFYWDHERRLRLPPLERRDRVDELAVTLAERGEGWARWARRRWRRHARRHWRAAAALPSPHLPGALLAVRRSAWQAAGPFDAGYRLYFEESDWLRRAWHAGLGVVHEPRAEALHHYNRSGAAEPRAAAWFAESADRFARRWYGPAFRRLRRFAAPRRSRLAWPPPLPGWDVASGQPPRLDLCRQGIDIGGLWIELSPVPRGFPAAAEPLAAGAGAWEMPREPWHHIEGRWRLAIVGDNGDEHAAWSFDVTPGADGA